MLELPQEFYKDAIRPGLAVYGYGSGIVSPILSIYAPIIKIAFVRQGEHISYGDYTAPRDMLVASIRAGYADGIRRKADPNADNRFVSVNGVLCPIVGQVCMDITMVDVSKVKICYRDKVFVLGNGISANDIALAENTNVYEVLTSFKGRVNRRYIKPRFN